MEDNKNVMCINSQSQSGQVKSFGEILHAVEDQIFVSAFSDDLLPVAQNIALIIAEVYALSSSGTCMIHIGGQDLPAQMVADVYRRLEFENIDDVISRYTRVPYEIRHTKTYLRTALYNSAFEFESRAVNAVRKDIG